jgi:hypothetical protein
MDFHYVSLHIIYNSQHFESIEYFNDVPRFLHVFKINDPKAITNLGEFSFSCIFFVAQQ